ncbi:hypothetical protein ACJ73_07384 [Blastomyces percursus]|uniref:CS domain-containing protein n=1 Tax=Blastomyces percursus TaxID=1658174 RepID=A0A1J9PY65_9EURO|nr:hypothetical protein ACJ73_07384 [Blastomyces percursus]
MWFQYFPNGGISGTKLLNDQHLNNYNNYNSQLSPAVVSPFLFPSHQSRAPCVPILPYAYLQSPTMANTQTPEVLWAQRSSSTEPEKNILYVHLGVPDVSPTSAKLSLTPTSISFSGHSDTKKVDYKVDLELYDEIDVDNSKSHHTPRGVDLVLRKKEAKEEYWPRFLKESKKVHFLKTDFDKWVDEDEQDAADADDFGNLGDMGGMGGMEGMGGGMGGIDFSKLGAGLDGMSGMGDMDAMGEGGEDDGSDDEMPALEEEGKDASATDSKPKIEEVA